MPYRLSIKPYRLPFRQPLRTAHGLWSTREGVWVRLESDDGRVAFGEAAPVPAFGAETVETVMSTLRGLGEKPAEADLERVLASDGCAAFALGSAMEALSEGSASAGEGGVDYVSVAGLLPAGNGVFPELERKLELGFRCFKWKVGVGDPRDERAMLDDVLAMLPTQSRLRLDANGGWDRRQAEAWLECAAERRMIEYVEQPVSGEEPAKAQDLLMGLAEDYPTPLALDESVVSWADVARWSDLGWPGVWVIKPALLGDPTQIRRWVREHQPDVVFSSALETTVGARNLLDLVLSTTTKASSRPVGCGVWPLFDPMWANGPTAMPFLRRADVDHLKPEETWNGVS